MARIGKWIDGLSPEDPIVDVAAKTLQARLSAVEYYLPRAAERSGESVDDVHQLRVSTRRARAAIALYRELLPKFRTKRINKKLQRIRQAAGEARDCDVLIQRLSSESGSKKSREELERILKRLKRQRRSAQPVIEEICKRYTSKGKLRRRTEKLIARIRPRSKNGNTSEADLPFRDWAPHVFEPVVVQFLAAVPGADHCLEDLHQFRIYGKALRYAMELLADAYPPEFRDELYPLIGQLQEMLGNVNDHCSAATRFQDYLAESDDKAEQKIFTRLLQDEQQLIESSQNAFWTWWSPEFHQNLETQLRKYTIRP